ncbi:MFS transporter [Streptomyces luteolus]|uniref:MFS transporter n=1 Tax=Streptomyces luteolus TaxID=3043615 RepID=A0ABT6SXW8_9ACTN|nr:MFS transporter [Streptomyces sp. B-S-A12]MDI3420434.1 MFS transporter [Streptomyces sp. B-S-A12]
MKEGGAVPPYFPKARYRATLAGITVNAFGNGLMSPYVMSWLAALPHGSVRVAGILFGATGAGQLFATLYAGRILTVRPPRTVLVVGLSFSAASAALLTEARGLALAAAALFTLGLSQGIASAAQATALGTLKFTAGGEDRVWSHLQVVFNVGQGIGILGGGYLVSGDLVAKMQPVFLLNAFSFAVFALIARFTLPGGSPSRSRTQQQPSGSYLSLLTQRPARQLVVGDMIFFTFGIGFLLLLPLLASQAHMLSMRQAAALLAANTLIIICCQLTVTRLVRHIRRPAAVRLLFAGAAFSWALVALASQAGARWQSLALVWSAVVLFSMAECLHTACLVPQLRDAVSEAERSRILALHVFAGKAGLIVGPALGGIAISVSVALPWIMAGCLLAIPAMFRWAEITSEESQAVPAPDASGDAS